MLSIPATEASVNGACSVAVERRKRELIVQVAQQAHRITVLALRRVERRRIDSPPTISRREVLEAERNEAVARAAAIDAELALLAVVREQPHLSPLEVDYAATHGLLPDDELGGGW